MTDKLHSVESAAEFLGGISPWTIRQYLTRGKLTRVKVGARTMIRESDLLKLIRVDDKAANVVEPVAVAR